MDNLQISLNKIKSKKSTNKDNSLTINLIGSEKLLPCDPFNASISEIDVYNDEREKCDKIRLTVCVNPICSNVLFNNITEIVKNEGTKDVELLNDPSTINSNFGDDVKFKESEILKTTYEAIRDTQLSNNINGWKYHCGLDIFNNHLLRSKTFKTVCPLENENKKDDKFNTIDDFMRSYDGKQIEGYSDKGTSSERPDIDLHLYTIDEILTYKESINNNLKEENGWFGFTNIGRMKIYNDESSDPRNMDYDWFNVINYKKSCDFIDMYPTRELFKFDPIYNTSYKRLEKNWNYILTYPSSSTTEDISFIKTHKNGSTSLKAMLFDDSTSSSNGTSSIKIWSVSKHGLSEGDIINLYKNDDIVLKNVKVVKVDSDYIFYVYNGGVKLSNKWVKIEKGADKAYYYNENGGIETTYTVSEDRKTLNEGQYFIVNNEKCNVDDSAQDISFTRVVKNNEVEYYVRIFSKLPNWKFADKKITEKLLYQDDKSYINEYQKQKYEFSNTIGKLAFAKNIYSDNITEIVFTDDINIGSLRDNLGRPLSDIYFTIIKNNAGYREWYGKPSIPLKIKDNKNIEYSHCFGKLNCAFKLSDESIVNENYKNVSMINNIDNTYSRNGLDVTLINNNRMSHLDNDEIEYNRYDFLDDDNPDFDNDIHYYGDLCCYSRVVCDEQIIQDIGYRFNTAQRELDINYTSPIAKQIIKYDDFESDDFDDNGFKVKPKEIQLSLQRKEGYYYNPHYRIRIKSYDNNITEIYPKLLTAKSIELYNGKTKLYTLENHDLGNGDKMFIYDLSSDTKYDCIVETVSNKRNLILNVYDENGDDVKLPDYSNKRRYKYFKVIEDIPTYAFFIKDGSCRYVYRKLLQNGFDDKSEIEEYPFANGALYINKNINLFLRRQNPNGDYDITTNNISYEKENKYYEEENITC